MVPHRQRSTGAPTAEQGSCCCSCASASVDTLTSKGYFGGAVTVGRGSAGQEEESPSREEESPIPSPGRRAQGGEPKAKPGGEEPKAESPKRMTDHPPDPP
eukprot:1161855-Pelagomonas_calceolata.AAC.2